MKIQSRPTAGETTVTVDLIREAVKKVADPVFGPDRAKYAGIALSALKTLGVIEDYFCIQSARDQVEIHVKLDSNWAGFSA